MIDKSKCCTRYILESTDLNEKISFFRLKKNWIFSENNYRCIYLVVELKSKKLINNIKFVIV